MFCLCPRCQREYMGLMKLSERGLLRVIVMAADAYARKSGRTPREVLEHAVAEAVPDDLWRNEILPLFEEHVVL